MLGSQKTPRKPADWTKDSPELKKERSGYWLTGLGTGPDTTCFVLCTNLVLTARLIVRQVAQPPGLHRGSRCCVLPARGPLLRRRRSEVLTGAQLERELVECLWW